MVHGQAIVLIIILRAVGVGLHFQTIAPQEVHLVIIQKPVVVIALRDLILLSSIVSLTECLERSDINRCAKSSS